jgi:hypothetical protein
MDKLIETKGIGVKVFKILEIVKERVTDEETINQLVLLTNEYSEHHKLGKVFGFSVGDYAFAALKWIGSDYSSAVFDRLFQLLPASRKESINELISSNAYTKI